MEYPDFLNTWLSNGISKKPLLLHGTSAEAIMETVKTGSLPTGLIAMEDVMSSNTIGNIHFASTISLGLKYAMGEAKYYAEQSGFSHCIYNKIGIVTPELHSDIPYWQSANESGLTAEFMYDRLKKYGIEISLDDLIAIDIEARKRKGVIIEPDISILETPNYPVFGGNDLIFECPNGLDKKYIKGIKLLGDEEKRLMNSFLDGRMKYNGFKLKKE